MDALTIGLTCLAALIGLCLILRRPPRRPDVRIVSPWARCGTCAEYLVFPVTCAGCHAEYCLNCATLVNPVTHEWRCGVCASHVTAGGASHGE